MQFLLYIENNYQNTNLQELSWKFGFSKAYINRVFKGSVGTTVQQYIKSLRMVEASKLLANPDNTVIKVAELVGYNDCSYFIEEYKKFYGYTPKGKLSL